MRRLWTLAALLALAGCGISPQDEAQPIVIPRGPFSAVTSPTPLPTTTGSYVETLYLVRDGLLVAQVRHVATESSVQDLLDDLVAGPTEAETDAGMSSALVGVDVKGVTVDAGYATVDLGAQGDGGARNDSLLAYAQVVCTLTTREDVRGVSFTRDGKAIDVPRGDSSVSPGPLTKSDYITVLVR